MKKQYFMIAAAATLFAACAETDVINDIIEESAPQAIGFETFANKATRVAAAENSTATTKQGLENHHNDFVVWAYKSTTTDYVFDRVNVEAQLVEGSYVWKYSPLKYWDKAADAYEFYAAAPNDGNWELNEKTGAQDDNYFTYDNLELKGNTLASTSYVESLSSLTNDCDLMIASPAKVEKVYTDVNLEFNHILSRLNITVKKGSTISGSDKLVLTSISVNKMVNIGSFSEDKTAAVQNGTTARWTPTTNTCNYVGNSLDEVTTTSAYVLQSLVIPQTVSYQQLDRDGSDKASAEAPYLYLEYTIGGEPFNATYNLANAFGLSELGTIAFNEGWQNTLNITIDASIIKFEADSYVWENNAKSGTID